MTIQFLKNYTKLASLLQLMLVDTWSIPENDQKSQKQDISANTTKPKIGYMKRYTASFIRGFFVFNTRPWKRHCITELTE